MKKFIRQHKRKHINEYYKVHRRRRSNYCQSELGFSDRNKNKSKNVASSKFKSLIIIKTGKKCLWKMPICVICTVKNTSNVYQMFWNSIFQIERNFKILKIEEIISWSMIHPNLICKKWHVQTTKQRQTKFTASLEYEAATQRNWIPSLQPHLDPDST